MNFNLLLGKLLMYNPRFFHYLGSLTTPPCAEVINWFVFNQPIHVLYEDLDPFISRWIKNSSFSDGKVNCRKCFHSKGREVVLVKAEAYY